MAIQAATRRSGAQWPTTCGCSKRAAGRGPGHHYQRHSNRLNFVPSCWPTMAILSGWKTRVLGRGQSLPGHRLRTRSRWINTEWRPPPVMAQPTTTDFTTLHQYPTGAVMSLARRQQILSIARTHNAGCWKTTMTANSAQRPPYRLWRGWTRTTGPLHGFFLRCSTRVEAGHPVVPSVWSLLSSRPTMTRPGQCLCRPHWRVVELGFAAPAPGPPACAAQAMPVEALAPCLGKRAQVIARTRFAQREDPDTG